MKVRTIERRHVAWLLAAFAILVAIAPTFLPSFYVTLLDYIGLSSIVALGLVLLTGVGGMTSFGQAAFVGLGAYTTAALSTGALGPSPALAWLQGSPSLGLVVGLILTAILSLVLGAMTLKLSGHYLPLGTIAWGTSLYYLFGTSETLGGQSGTSDIPAISLFGWSLNAGHRSYYLIWLIVAAALVVTVNLLDSRGGRAIRALKSGTVMAEAMGIDTTRMKIAVFFIAAEFACVAGWLYAHMQRFVNPSPFGVSTGVEYLFMVVVGGSAYPGGALLGAGLVTGMKQWLQDLLPRLVGNVGNYEVIVFGIIIILILQRSREGIWGVLVQWTPWRIATRRVPAIENPLKRRPCPPAGQTILEAQHVVRRFGGLAANDDVSFLLRAGEILALIGPNGAGKSTMFNMLSGVDRPTSGEVRLLGQTIEGKTSRDIAKRGLSRTFQHVRLIPSMTALENVAIGAHLRGHKSLLSMAFHADRADERLLLAEARIQLCAVGLEQHMHSPAGSLSLGQQRLVEIARALASDPCVMLLDEPAAGLRHREKLELAALLRRLRAEGMAVLVVEHDMDFVMGLADRIVVMNFGRRIAQGLPAEIQQDPHVIDAYLGGAAV